MIFAKIIDDAKDSLGVTQAALADIVGVSESVLSEAKRGEKLPTLNTFKKLSETPEVYKLHKEFFDNFDTSTLSAPGVRYVGECKHCGGRTEYRYKGRAKNFCTRDCAKKYNADARNKEIKTIERFVEKASKEYSINQVNLARMIDVKTTAVHKWMTGEEQPTASEFSRMKSVPEVYEMDKTFFDTFDTSKLKDPEPETNQPLRNGRRRGVIQLDEVVTIQSIERKFGSLSNCPDDYPPLVTLRNRLNAETETKKTVGYQKHHAEGYSKIMVERMRLQKGVSMTAVSQARGRSNTWYSGSFLIGTFFLDRDLTFFANYFDVPKDTFLEVNE